MGPKQTSITLPGTREFLKFCGHRVALAPRVPKNPKTSIILKGKGFKFWSEELQCNDFSTKNTKNPTKYDSRIKLPKRDFRQNRFVFCS